MEPLSEALRMLRRQAELETAMRKPGGIKDTGNATRQMWHWR